MQGFAARNGDYQTVSDDGIRGFFLKLMLSASKTMNEKHGRLFATDATFSFSEPVSLFGTAAIIASILDYPDAAGGAVVQPVLSAGVWH